MKKYLSFFKLKFSIGLQYRAAAIAGICTQLFFGFVYIMVYKAFYTSGNADVSMSLKDTTTYIWLNQIFYSLIRTWHYDGELIKTIKNGNIAYELCRPQNIYSMWFTRLLSSKLSGVFLRALPMIIVIAFLPSSIGMRLPYSSVSFLAFVLALIISGLLVSAIITIVYIFISYAVDEKGIVSFHYSISELLSGQIMPLPLMPKFLSTFASFLPFAYVSDFAFRIYVGNITGLAIIKGLIFEILWLIILVLIGRLLTQRIVKKVSIQGG